VIQSFAAVETDGEFPVTFILQDEFPGVFLDKSRLRNVRFYQGTNQHRVTPAFIFKVGKLSLTLSI
jgi:hypothetical protein